MTRSKAGARTVALAATTLAVTGLAWAGQAAESGVRQAQAHASAEARSPEVLVVAFHADWCLPCLRLEAVTFSSPEVREAARGVLMVKADVTDEAGEASRDGRPRFAVEALPAVVFLDAQRRDLGETERLDPTHPAFERGIPLACCR